MRARLFATDKHRGQSRKYTGEPYIYHPCAVAELVRSVPLLEIDPSVRDTCKQQMLAAAWLHDVIEDCGVKDVEIFNLFGSEVYFMVAKLTNTSQPGNRKERKARDREWLRTASPDTKTVKICDLIDNSSSIMQHDPNFAVVYLKEKRQLLEVLTEGDPTLWCRADQICKDAGF